MNNLNTVLIEGNLTRDPKEVVFAGDHAMCRFSIANNRYYMKKGSGWQTDTSFFIVEVYGPASKACVQYLRKGRGVRVVGRLKQNSWTESGMPRELVTIIAEHIEFQPDRQKAAREQQASPMAPEASTMAQSSSFENENTGSEVSQEEFECTTDISDSNEEQTFENESVEGESIEGESFDSTQQEEQEPESCEGGAREF